MGEKLKQFGWTIVIIGIVLIVMGVGGIIDSSKTPVAFEDLKLSDLKSGMIVDGNVDFNLGCFEESYRTKYGVKTGGTQLYYAVAVEEKIIALKCPEGGKISNALEQQASVFLNYSGKGEPELQSIAIKGKVKKMDSKTEGYLKDFLYYDELGGQILEISPYTIETGVMSRTSSIALTAVGAVCIAIPLLIMLAGAKSARKSYSSNYDSNAYISNSYGSTDTYDSYTGSTSGSYTSSGTSDTGYKSFGQDFEEYERSLQERDNH